VVLSGFALAQPLFDLLGKNAAFFVAHGSTALDVVVFALLVTLVPPAVILGVELVVGLADPRARMAVHLAAVAFLTALFALQIVKRAAEGPSAALLAAAVVVGVLAALAYRRFAPARMFLTILAPVPLLFLALFLFASPVGKITLPAEAEAHAATVRASAPVVMIVFDEFPVLSLLNGAGEIDARRYPSFAALALDSTWFRRTLSVSGDTTKAVPALLTGKKPDPDRLPFFADHRQNLFTLLGGTYRLNVVEPITRLCPAELCPENDEAGFVSRQRRLLSDVGVVYGHVLLPRDLSARLPSISSTWMDFRDNALHDLKDRDEEFRAFVASIEPTSQPTLWFLHTLLPHHPWRYLPSGSEYARATLIPGLVGDRWSSDAVLAAQAHQRHLLQVGFVDRLLGELLARLRATRLYERSLIVVTADHGVSFRPNGDRRRLTDANLAEVGLVPLFVKAPRQSRGRVVDTVMQTTSVLAIAAKAVGIELPWQIDRGPAVPRMELESKLAAALRGQTALFGSDLYRVGPHLELVGRAVADVSVIDNPNLTRELFDQESELSRAHIVGLVKGNGAQPGLDIAVAVNGTIAATARTFSFLGEVRFEALVPESAFRPREDEVEVYVITAGGDLLKARGRP
jgi:sulfatase-like protein